MIAPKIPVPVMMADVFGWLNQFNESHLHPIPRQLVESMNENIRARNADAAWGILDEILEFLGPPQPDEVESVEILTSCGYAAFRMGNESRARKLLNEAVHIDNKHSHNRAVASWMLGCLLWSAPLPKMREAVDPCQESIEIFDSLAKLRTISGSKATWYKNCADAMRTSLEQFVSVVSARPVAPAWMPASPSAPASSPSAPSPTPAVPSPKIPTSGPSRPVKRDRVRSFPVLGSIPAGNMANMAAPSGTLGIDEVILDENRHRIISLKRGVNTVNIADGRGCFVLQVSGNSMNNADPETIEDGDYVLLREQASAEPGDIVAVEIVGLDNRATLKRYSMEAGKIVLEPESKDPAFQNIHWQHEFTNLDDDFHIRGIALAVLKRIEV